MEQKVISILARIYKKDASELSGTTLLKEDLNIKSMNLLEISAVFENELGLKLPMAGIMKAKTIQDILDLIQK